MAEWQLKTFQAVQASYSAQIEAYRALRGPTRDAPEPRFSDRAVEQREIRRGAFELLFQRLGELSGASVDVARPRYLQFFERSFEWSEMSYNFLLDATRGRRSRSVGGDARFLDFLEASYAQVLLPVSPRDTLSVLFFLASGMLWDGAGDRAAVHEVDIDVATALKQLCRVSDEPTCVGKAWEVVVPTTAAVLQDGSGSLADLAAVCVDLEPKEV